MKLLALALVLLATVTVHGQTAAPLAFEVESVNPTEPPSRGYSLSGSSPERFAHPFATVSMLIWQANRIEDVGLGQPRMAPTPAA